MVIHKSEDYKTIAVKYLCRTKKDEENDKNKIKRVVKKKDNASVRVVALT